MIKITKSKTAVSIALAVIVVNFFIFAYPGGESGYTLKSGTNGCYCHGAVNSSINVVIAGPASLAPSQTGNYTVTISNGSGTGVGVDIAASSGTLTNSDSNLKILSGELTQPSKKSYSGGSYTFKFTYTAPSTTGPQTIYATGCSSKPQWNFATNYTVNVTSATDVKSDNINPNEFKLYGNFPNPFNPSTKIQFSLPTNNYVTLKVYDISGREVASLVNSQMNAGQHLVNFDASNLSSGIYYYKLSAGSFTQTNKMILMK